MPVLTTSATPALAYQIVPPTVYASAWTNVSTEWLSAATTTTAEITTSWPSTLATTGSSNVTVFSLNLHAYPPSPFKRRRSTLAGKRARRLLLRLLSEAQQREYADSKTFTVHAANGKVFRLRKGRTAELLGSDGQPVAAYCVHLAGGFPAEDNLAALLLTLQTDPAEFERIANVTPLRRKVPA